MKEFLQSLIPHFDIAIMRQSNYWLSPSPFETAGRGNQLLLLALIVFIWAIWHHWRTRLVSDLPSYAKLRRGIAISSIYLLIFMPVWVFVRAQGIYLLSNRLIGASILLLWLIWLLWIGYYRWRIFPKLRAKEIIAEHRQKYLPKQKNR